ncbi:flagellar motor switch protein FliN [Sulfurihydrogenibium azorense Az-Fu1]|jgi:flagellar motor switch protein FliN/FliY|uniref:Flagellar motor switch protein FliN n=1 Tax=Sulfurihydrogenibium azorense (strain DSM 15241 / OCM 825 / Az-Fu1) TaxID=204536 RepID=C1DW10_SULAA|nr:FliM/FliN family flagellar motor switch protein [Sulfurihydrogenibium azorense]ACN98452.1 flagellar motor switch protein FliN [Sulfurihydrogenibium azorense Az-Fu1]
MEEKENNNQENQEEISQEDLAKAWAEMLEQEPVVEEKEEKKEETTPSESQEDLAAAWAQMLEPEKNEEKENINEEPIKDQPKIESKEEKKDRFQNLPADIEKKLNLLLDLPITITVEIGSKVMTIEEIVKLSPSSVVDLDRFITEPIDLKVNGVLVAKGELYQVEDQFAIKIKEILTKEERVNLISKQFKRL